MAATKLDYYGIDLGTETGRIMGLS